MPRCGQKPPEPTFDRGPAAVELGFAQPEVVRPTGVAGAASFSWTQDPETVRRVLAGCLDEELIENEYGRVLTGRDFWRMIECNCPIEFVHSVGTWFS